MKNFVQPGERITFDAPAAVASGAGVIVGQLFGVAFGDAAAGQPVTIAVSGVFDMPKVSTDAVDIGDPVFWDDANAVVTLDDATGANARIGIAVTTAGNPSPSVHVRLDG